MAKPDSPFPSNLKLNPWNPDEHAPCVGLINPKSGGKMGEPILEVCQRSDYYKDCMFHIIECVKGGEVMAKFRTRLNEAKAAAAAKADPAFRPRVICGGGDGTASFALLIVFKALKAAEDGSDDQGNGFTWTDEELEKYFPALVQMPLGTGNDLGAILGWGRKYPGYTQVPHGSKDRHAHNLVQWFDAAVAITTPVVNFDVWGYMPAPGKDAMDVKICELASAETQNHETVYTMKPPDVVVPFLVLLYSSFGWSAAGVARFQLARHETQIGNTIEYGRVGLGLLTGPKSPQLRNNLEGVTVTMPPGEPLESNGTNKYFPPGKKPDQHYWEVGFMNINSYTGGILTGQDRAPLSRRWCACGAGRKRVEFGDGKADFYREKQTTTAVKTGTVLQTDKRRGGVFEFAAAKGKGLFLQYDGEARFAFHPEGNAWRMDVQHVLTIPVVCSPSAHKAPSSAPVCFRVEGNSVEVERVRQRIKKWVEGGLVQELNATADEIRSAGIPLATANSSA